MYWMNVKNELNRQKKTQIELAESIGLSIGTLRNKINLDSLPTFETAIKISEFLNCSMEYLLYGTDSNGLSGEEKTLINDYRELSEDQKKAIQNVISAFNGISPEITPDGDNFIIVK